MRSIRRFASGGLRLIVWEGLLLFRNLELEDDVIIKGWRSQETTRRIAALGYKVIAGLSNY